jgi:uncharacterized membrane protein YraQ (UPF0718 family)
MGNSSTLVLFAIALALAGLAARRNPHLVRQGVMLAVERFFAVLPRMALALLTAGFVGKLVPSGPIANHIGPDSGISGILLASLVGGFIPSGPIVSFPVVVVLLQAGAGIPQVVAFLSAWSVVALHRVLIFEIPLMGWRFCAVRLIASAPLAPLSGIFAELLLKVMPLA